MLKIFFETNFEYYIFFTFIIGLLFGSFLNVVIFRLPVILKREWRKDCTSFLEENYQTTVVINTDAEPKEPFNLVKPDSTCPHCGHKIRAWENIPVLSYLFLHGKCSQCKTSISIRYPLVELTSAFLATICAWHFGVSVAAVAAMCFSWALLALALIDYDTQYLPDNITLPFLWAGLVLNILHIYTDLTSAVIGAVAGYLALWLVYHGFKLLTKKEGMGFGDLKLLAMLGAWMGWQYLPQIILLSSLVGSVIGISLILFRGHQRQIPIPFGPYLATAGWLAFIWGDDINQLYLSWLNHAT